MKTRIHYEYWPGHFSHTFAKPWRIANDRDDFITRVATEEEAIAYVREHNAQVTRPKTWKYGDEI